jgi:hypothetical protein
MEKQFAYFLKCRKCKAAIAPIWIKTDMNGKEKTIINIMGMEIYTATIHCVNCGSQRKFKSWKLTKRKENP